MSLLGVGLTVLALTPSYDVQLRADQSGERWTGRERVTFTNPGPAPLHEIWLRTWANGVTGCSDPALRLHSVRGAKKDRAELGCTAVRLRLDAPLAPGATGSVAFRFDLEVPSETYRFGTSRGVRLLSNALPILAVRESDGWRRDRYSRRGETFMAELSDWRVRMKLPRGLDVAGPGKRSGRGRSVAFALPHARDFSWAAGHLRTATKRIAGVTVRVASRGGTSVAKKVSRALPRLIELLGPYGRDEITVVVVPHVAMEHAGLIMTPEDEHLVAHELAHLWWYDMVGSDQARAPWLDEGFAQWSGWRAFVPATSVTPKGAACGPRGGAPDALLTRPMSYWARHRRHYAGAVYFRGACLLDQLEAHLGRPAFAAALRAYVDAHRWGWHTAEAFTAAMDAAAGDDRLAPVWERFGVK